MGLNPSCNSVKGRAFPVVGDGPWDDTAARIIEAELDALGIPHQRTDQRTVKELLPGSWEYELARAGINVIGGPPPPTRDVEVCRVEGALLGFTFRRAWYYWMVSGMMPLEVARRLWDDPEGKRSVRVGGHCGCPSPDEYGAYNVDGKMVVLGYHVDTVDGLRLLVEAIRGLPQG